MSPPSTASSFFNDSKATNVDATGQSHRPSFSTGIHSSSAAKIKTPTYTQLSQLLRQRVRAVYTIGSSRCQNRVATARRSAAPIPATTLDKAVREAAAAARPGDVVLLAPACSSFDQFESYEHRGRVFKELVQRVGAESLDSPSPSSAAAPVNHLYPFV